MKKYLEKAVIISIIVFIFASCGEPPKDTKEIGLLSWIINMIPRLNAVKDDKIGRKNLSKELENTVDIISFYKDLAINIKSSEEKTSDFMYSIENNSFYSKKAMYVTFSDNKMFVSFDKTNWVVFNFSLTLSSNGDDEDKPENFKSDYKIDYNLDKSQKSLEIIYSISFTPTDTMQTIILKEDKPVFSLKKDMILVDKEIKNTTIDLKKNILYIPENTTFTGNMSVKGNIIETRTDGEYIVIKSLKDIFVYVKNKMISLSFNRKKWSFSILSLKFSPTVTIKSVDDKKIQFDIFVDLSYNE